MNLLSNASQAIIDKGKISITTAPGDDGGVRLEVSDTGTGIPEEIIDKIFDPFFTTKPVGKGTGLGLNIVYNIINKHGGKIEVKSEVGKGTTFIVQLPPQPPPDAL
jgi:signal transduction histidine kinase